MITIPPVVKRRRHHPPRQPRNGHHPDCPLWRKLDAKFCRVCRGDEKGAPK